MQDWDEDILRDPELRRRGQEAAEVFRRRRELDTLSATPVIAELRDADFDIKGIGDLKRLPKSEYQRAIPILLKWLAQTDWIGLKAGIARTLRSSWARPIAAQPLITAFLSIEHSLGENRGLESYEGTVKWTIGDTLSVVSDDSVFDELTHVIRDRRHGRTRQMVAYALANLKDPRAIDVLIEMLDDEDVTSHAAFALGKLRAVKAKPHLGRLLEHPRPLVRREAKKALAKIEKAEQAGPHPHCG